MASRMDAGPGGADEAVHARPALRAHPAVAKGGAVAGFDDISSCSKPVIAAIGG